jgi:hypothetical protein
MAIIDFFRVLYRPTAWRSCHFNLEQCRPRSRRGAPGYGKNGSTHDHPAGPPVTSPCRVHVESMPAGRRGKALHAKTPFHPRAFQVLAQRGNSSMLSRQFAELLAQAGLREKTTRASQGKTRSVRRQVNALSFHSLRWTATTLLH